MKNIKVGFYFNNSKYEKMDFSSPQDGNPGVGGVEYMISLVSYYLADFYNVYVFANHINNLSNKTTSIKIDSFENTLKEADKLNIDFLICRSLGKKEYYDLLQKYKCKIIIWAHNFTKLKELNLISKNKQIIKYVCVGKHQYDMLNGHSIYNKATYIYNGLPLSAYESKNINANKDICYIGSIISGKGFDVCCRVWRRLYDNGYKVKFNVVGSAKLYNSNKKLGPYNIALADYEKEFINYLLGENGNLLEEVNLTGVLGHKDKIEVINNSYCGISASKEETFGLIAIEFGALGKPFAALQTNGYLDTVINGKTGYLVNNENELYNACENIMKMDSFKYLSLSNDSIENAKNYDISNIIDEWNVLINELVNNNKALSKKENISLLRKIRNLLNLVINYR